MRSLVLLLLAALPLSAQSTEDALKARLLRQPLYLRQTLGNDKLHFDPAGAPRGKVVQTSWTLSGVRIDSVKLKDSELQLSGVRIGTDFVDKAPRREVLQVFTGYGANTEDEKITFTLDAPTSGDYGPALDAIFTTDLADLVPRMPVEWQSYAKIQILKLQPEDKPRKCGTDCTVKIGGPVTAPKVLSAPEPEFDSAARARRKSGNVLIYLQVDKDGLPTHLRILNPTGLGLDEQAILAVRRYRFNPAMQGDKPVSVEMNVEVNFQIF